MTSAVPTYIHDKLKEIAKKDVGNFIKLNEFIIKFQKISLRKNIKAWSSSRLH